MIEVDRKGFLASVGVGALELIDPEEGLGYDTSPSAHMWRTIANPDKPL